MKTKLAALSLLVVALFAAGVRAEATPATAPAAPAMASIAAPAPNQTVYGQRLPSVNELSNIATAQGLTIDRVEQTASQVTVVYKYANGQTNTVAYLLLPGASGAAPASVATPSTPAPAVVYYQPAPRVVYYDDYPPSYYSYPSYWYPPVSIGLGFGFHSGGFHGGGFHGGGFGFRGGFRR